MWVMPSSSARCAQLPRAADKVPFYKALKKFRDYLNGHIEHLDESEVVFDDPKYKNCVESDKPPAEFTVTAFGPDGLPIDDGKKKRGRPKKTKIILNENGEPIQVKNEMKQNAQSSTSSSDMMSGAAGGPIDPSKKKRGRPKKVKGNDSNNSNNSSNTTSSSTPITRVPTPAVTPNGNNTQQQQNPQFNNQGGQNNAGNGNQINRNSVPNQQQTNIGGGTSGHFNSPNFNILHNPVDTLTPPPSVGYQQQNLSFSNSMPGGGNTGTGGTGSSKGGGSNGGNSGSGSHPNQYQQSPQPNSQGGYPQSDVGSDMSAAMSCGEHMSNSPAAVTSPVDFGRSSCDNTQNECRFSSPASTISEQQSQHSQHMQHSMQQQQQQMMQNHQQQQRQHQGKSFLLSIILN